MTATLQTHETFRITATAASPAADLAIGSVASLLGIGPRQAADRLASFPSVLAQQVPGPRARQLSAMLTLLGLRVRLDPDFSRVPAAGSRVDLALLPVMGADCDALALRLAAVLGPQPSLRARLEMPGGLVLSGRTLAESVALRKALRRQRALRILESDPGSALFDLFAPSSPRLGGQVSRLGLAPCRFSGAVAAGMNLATGRVLLKAAGSQAVLIDRAFQRFDLVMRAAPDHPSAELADFLATRRGAAAVPAGGGWGLPLRIDGDLSRRTAEHFSADYAALGLKVAARLRGNLPFDLRQNR